MYERLEKLVESKHVKRNWLIQSRKRSTKLNYLIYYIFIIIIFGFGREHQCPMTPDLMNTQVPLSFKGHDKTIRRKIVSFVSSSLLI